MDKNKNMKADLPEDPKMKNREKDHVTGDKTVDLRDDSGDKERDLAKQKKQLDENERTRSKTAGSNR
jgi:hypothetical protein